MIYMRLLSFLILAIAFVQVQLGCALKSSPAQENEIIYLQEGTNLVTVFNIEELRVSHEDIEYLEKRDFKYGEFGGGISFCSNDEFYCLKGGIIAVVPRHPPDRDSWSHSGVECTLIASNLDQSTIDCRRNEHSVCFVYSTQKGILSYSVSYDPNDRFILLGNEGLFARASH